VVPKENPKREKNPKENPKREKNPKERNIKRKKQLKDNPSISIYVSYY
jgi:hypothetical protein